ncbi:carotenoid oxygenase family protein [Streptomyces sp. NPDC057271]|uniref:carotenoid oxygenase family protein n=1 Tax=Streptomyces sp. NPDC057271 TaxID=3346078 RepID=UPI00364173ED
MSSRVSPFLQGAFTPLYTERTAHRLPVKGRIPPELDGLFTQIGGNPVAPPRRRGAEDYSWFSQDGMVCGIRLRDGRAEWFRNRWIRSPPPPQKPTERPHPQATWSRFNRPKWVQVQAPPTYEPEYSNDSASAKGRP